MNVKEYKNGDIIWYVTGFSGFNLIAIRCSVTVNDYFRKIDPRAYIFYELDEPIGHSVGFSELFKTKKCALLELKTRINLAGRSNIPNKQFSLEDFRNAATDFIISTHPPNQRLKYGKDPFIYKQKEHIKEWVTCFDLMHGKAKK